MSSLASGNDSDEQSAATADEARYYVSCAGTYIRQALERHPDDTDLRTALGYVRDALAHLRSVAPRPWTDADNPSQSYGGHA